MALAMILLLIALATFLALLTRSAPAWYRPPEPTDQQALALADQVEFRLLEEFQKVRPEPEPWKLRVREEHINAWLATKLRDWIESRPDLHWPENIDLPQVRFEPDGISLAVSIDAMGPAKIVVTRIRPRFEDGELFATVEQFSLGRLNIPGEPVQRIADLVDRHAADFAGQEPVAQLLLRMLRGEERIDPVLELADSRRVRLTDIQLDTGSLVLTAQTLSGDAP